MLRDDTGGPVTTEQFAVTGQTGAPSTSHYGAARAGEVCLADVAQFLASDASSFVIGETVTARSAPDVVEQL